VRKLALVLLAPLAALWLVSCSKDIQNTDAVRQGVIDYLTARESKTGVSMSLMQVDVTSVSFQTNEARATVAIRAKTGGNGTPMMMNYTLQRQGNKWVVQGRTESGVNPHGGTPQASPENAPPPQMPPGHPPVSPKQ
jgi:hypothetical protein